MSEIEDRRQRAREAFHDGSPIMDGDIIDQVHAAAEAAIETATRVQITPKMIRILVNGGASDYADLRDIFTLAGFEVET